MNNPNNNPLRPRWRDPDRDAALVFSPLAWLKLMYFLHAGETEVGGFGVSAQHDPLYVQNFVTVKQRTSCVTVEFADDAVADYFDACVDAGLTPSRFARIWCHTHPGSSPRPSNTDEDTFERVFGSCDWSLMFIVGRTGLTYARLSFSAGPGGTRLLPVAVDWSGWPQALAHQAARQSSWLADWAAEYQQNVQSIDTEVYADIDEAGFDRNAPLNPDDPFGVWPFIQRLTDEDSPRPDSVDAGKEVEA